MNAWRLVLALALLPLFGLPLAGLFLDDQALPLGGVTLLLVGGTLALALPVGTLLAVLLFRTDLPGRKAFLAATLFLLFVPLPVIVSSWQALVGSDGLMPLALWGDNAGRRWTSGLPAAVWIHALAGLPWVVLIVGIALTWVERELEEEALLSAPSWRVLWSVTMPRVRAGIAAAAVWLGVQTAADVSVTDMLLVRTYAEEVHTQFTLGGPDLVARTLRLALPGVLLTGAVLLWVLPRLEKAVPPLQLSLAAPRLFALGKSRWLWFACCVCAGTLLFLIPLGGLVWKLGLAGQPESWSVDQAWRQFHGELRLFGPKVILTLTVALLTGMVTTLLAHVARWLAVESRRMQWLLLGMVTLAWSLPAPLVGIGLKEVILKMVAHFPIWPLPELLYYQPSPLPILWVHVLRFFPFAVAILWPVVRMVPPELRDSARLDGAGPWREWWHVYLPLTRRGCAGAVLAVTALSLGEVGAGARVETPGWETFTKLIFDRMHFGADRNVAALSLVLLAAIAACFVLAWVITRCLRFATRSVTRR